MKQQEPLHPGKREMTLDFSGPIPAEQLFAHQDRVQIVFRGQIYTLSLTRNQKLILTK